MNIDVIKIYKQSKLKGRSDEDILAFIEYLESIYICNKAMEEAYDL